MTPSPVTYIVYMRSRKWKKRRRDYYKRHPKVCAVCPEDKQLTLHHISYDNLGDEKDEDLLCLCNRHHRELHKRFRHHCWENTFLYVLSYHCLEAHG